MMKRINLGRKSCGVLAFALLLASWSGLRAQSLINVDAGQGNKSGEAAVGSTGDYWNKYYPDDGSGGLFSDGVLVPLYDAGSVATGAGLLLYNVDSEANIGWGDEMYDYYLAATGTNLLVYITNAPAGLYDVYVYGHGSTDEENSIFDLSSLGSYYGRKQTSTSWDWNDGSMSWYEDANYVKYSQVAVFLGGNLLIEALPNASGQAIINGLQMSSVSIPSGDWDNDGIANATEIQTTGTDPKAADTDGDGIHDGQEQTDATDPNDPWSLTEKRLAWWSFDDSGTWSGDGGQSPVTTAHLNAVSGVTNGAVELQSAAGAAAKLIYNRVETSPAINATLNRGAIRFLFRPNWSTASGGPGSVARLVEFGLPSSGTNDGSWTLYVTADGLAVKFVTRALGGRREHLSASINWTSGQWYELVLDYDPTASELFVDGSSVATGTGVTDFIKPGNISIGSDGSDGPLGAAQWVDDPTGSDPNANWEWLDAIGDYAWGYWIGTWVEDWSFSHPDTYYREVYDYDWNFVYDGYGYWQGSPTGDNGSARGSFDEFATFNHPLNGGGAPPPVSLPDVSFDPAPGAELPVNLTLSVTGHPNATIHYTTDGSTPTTSSATYTGAITLATNDWTWSVDQVPTMVDWDSPSGNLVTNSSVAASSGNHGWKAFDASTSTHWRANGASGEWVSFEFPSERTIGKYALTSTDTDGPRDWTFQAWNGSGWVTLDSRGGRSGWASAQRREYTCSTLLASTKYRLHITSGNSSTGNPGSLITIGEIEMYEAKAEVAAFAVESGYYDSAIIHVDYFAPVESIAATVLDTDADGISDAEETVIGTDPQLADTDGDGVPDNIELAQGRDPLKGAIADTGGLTQLVIFTPLN